MLRVILGTSLCLLFCLEADDSFFKFEGYLGSPVTNINNMNFYAQAFIPYNPTIVEIGAYEGEGTFALGVAYPYGRVFAFEPNPRAYALMRDRVERFSNVVPVNLAVSTYNGKAYLNVNPDGVIERGTYLMPPKHDVSARDLVVPCVVLDDWCRDHGIDRVHFLRLDTGGTEYQILLNSPKMLSTALVVVIKTHLHQSNDFVILYPAVKDFLKKQGFELLSHWYQEGIGGEACFVRQYMYDSLFK